MKITMEMMDAAKYYTDETGQTEFHPMHGSPALRLSVEIEEANGKVNLETCTAMANEVIEKVQELTEKETEMESTLLSTFGTFFSETEETNGTGTVTRNVGGELTEVITDQAEHDAFKAEMQAKSDAALKHDANIDELMERLNW